MLVHHAEVIKPTLIKGPMACTAMQAVEFCRLERNSMLLQMGKDLSRALEKKGWILATWEDRGWEFIPGKPFGFFSSDLQSSWFPLGQHSA